MFQYAATGLEWVVNQTGAVMDAFDMYHSLFRYFISEI